MKYLLAGLFAVGTLVVIAFIWPTPKPTKKVKWQYGELQEQYTATNKSVPSYSYEIGFAEDGTVVWREHTK